MPTHVLGVRVVRVMVVRTHAMGAVPGNDLPRMRRTQLLSPSHETPYSCALCGSTSRRRLEPHTSNSKTVMTRARPGKTASHHMPAER